jgi:hypothetical protein
MSEIDNTTKRMKDPVEATTFLLEAVANDGAPGQIEAMEAAGQRQLVNSDRLPTDLRGDRAEFEALGFTFGEPDKDDPMFCAATLPPSWKREGSDHAMWSYLTDEHGRKRASIFYKAAFYDRSAFMNLTGVYGYASAVLDGRERLILDETWATQEAVAKALREARAQAEGQSAFWREHADSDVSAKYVRQYEDEAAKANFLLATVEGEL